MRRIMPPTAISLVAALQLGCALSHTTGIDSEGRADAGHPSGPLADASGPGRPDAFVDLSHCGDGRLDPGEQCDDGNGARWDGCAPDCRLERSVLMRDLAFAGDAIGCGPARPPANRFAEALGGAIAELNNVAASDARGVERSAVLLSLLGLDDGTGTDDPSLEIAWLLGRSDERGGFVVGDGSIDARLEPTMRFDATLRAHALAGGPAEIAFPTRPFRVHVRDAHLVARTDRFGDEVGNLEEGRVCGTLTIASLLPFTRESASLDILPPACSEPSVPFTLADIAIGGMDLSLARAPGASPDLDLDGDGLERFEIDRGDGRCVPVVTACVDGDGTRIPGRRCLEDPRIADGFSVELGFRGTRTHVTGARP